MKSLTKSKVRCSRRTPGEIGSSGRFGEVSVQGPSKLILSVAYTLLSSAPFCRLPLHLRFFMSDAHAIFISLIPLDRGEPRQKTRPSAKTSTGPLLALSSMVTTVLDLGGVSGKTGIRRESVQGVTERDGPIDVEDGDFRGGPRVWKKWKLLQVRAEDSSLSCALCHEPLDEVVSVQMNYAYWNRITSDSLYVPHHWRHRLIHPVFPSPISLASLLIFLKPDQRPRPCYCLAQDTAQCVGDRWNGER